MTKLFRLLLLACACTACPSMHAADRFAETRARIAAMLGSRIDPKGLPEQLPNPFTVGSGRAPTQDSRPGFVARVDDDESILARVASILKVSGSMRIGDTPHVVINASPYKEGDLLKIEGTEPPEYVRVVRIEQRSFTLSYNSASITVPLAP